MIRESSATVCSGSDTSALMNQGKTRGAVLDKQHTYKGIFWPLGTEDLHFGAMFRLSLRHTESTSKTTMNRFPTHLFRVPLNELAHRPSPREFRKPRTKSNRIFVPTSQESTSDDAEITQSQESSRVKTSAAARKLSRRQDGVLLGSPYCLPTVLPNVSQPAL